MRAFRICEACGLEDDEIASLIDVKSRSSLSREQEIELFDSTFKGNYQWANSEMCLPCVEAVLDAAEK